MTAVIIFTISFLGLLILFLSKRRELKTGVKTPLGVFLARFDNKSEQTISKLQKFVYTTIQTVKYFLLVHLPEKGKVKISETKESVLNKYNKQKDAIMGKKELSKNGASSFFLRKVSENKNSGNGNNNERGKIEEIL